MLLFCIFAQFGPSIGSSPSALASAPSLPCSPGSGSSASVVTSQLVLFVSQGTHSNSRKLGLMGLHLPTSLWHSEPASSAGPGPTISRWWGGAWEPQGPSDGERTAVPQELTLLCGLLVSRAAAQRRRPGHQGRGPAPAPRSGARATRVAAPAQARRRVLVLGATQPHTTSRPTPPSRAAPLPTAPAAPSSSSRPRRLQPVVQLHGALKPSRRVGLLAHAQALAASSCSPAAWRPVHFAGLGQKSPALVQRRRPPPAALHEGPRPCSSRPGVAAA